jgi:hypothetical protein
MNTAPDSPPLIDDELDLLASLVPLAGQAFQPHVGAAGAHFTRPMHVRLLRRRGLV